MKPRREKSLLGDNKMKIQKSFIIILSILILCIFLFVDYGFCQEKEEQEKKTEETQSTFKKVQEINPLYDYNPEGRRDPFYNLIKGKKQRKETETGVKPFMINEVKLKGIVVFHGIYSAMVVSPGGKSYTLYEGDKLIDGKVTEVGDDYVKFVKVLKSPIMLQKTKEIIKRIKYKEGQDID